MASPRPECRGGPDGGVAPGTSDRGGSDWRGGGPVCRERVDGGTVCGGRGVDDGDADRGGGDWVSDRRDAGAGAGVVGPDWVGPGAASGPRPPGPEGNGPEGNGPEGNGPGAVTGPDGGRSHGAATRGLGGAASSSVAGPAAAEPAVELELSSDVTTTNYRRTWGKRGATGRSGPGRRAPGSTIRTPPTSCRPGTRRDPRHAARSPTPGGYRCATGGSPWPPHRRPARRPAPPTRQRGISWSYPQRASRPADLPRRGISAPFSAERDACWAASGWMVV